MEKDVKDAEEVSVYSWHLNTRLTSSIFDAMSKGSWKSVKTHTLLRTPCLVSKLPHPLGSSLKFPCFKIAGKYYPYDSEELIDILENTTITADTPGSYTIAFDEPSDRTSLTTPDVGFLDKNWKWPVLMLKIIETLGCSVEKLASDPVLPEEFIVDCLRRNLGVETVKDCRILIFELLNNGMMEEVRQEEYKLVYHLSRYCLNHVREEFEDDLPLPETSWLLSQLLDSLGRVMRHHSTEFLRFVDLTSFFRYISFRDVLKHERALKMLVDLHCILSTHTDISGEYVESVRSKFYYKFKDRIVYQREIFREVMSRTTPSDRENMECLLWLRWTISEEASDNDEVLKLARQVFETECITEDNGTTFIPSFLKSFEAPRRRFYDIHISPFVHI